MRKAEKSMQLAPSDMEAIIEDLQAKQKLVASRLFKIGQALKAKDALIAKLQARLAGAARMPDPAVGQLKKEARQLRLEVTNVKTESLGFQRECRQLRLEVANVKMEQDAALVQLKKPAIEQAAAAPPAP